MRSGKDWTLMLQSYVILSLEVFDEDWIQRLANHDHCCSLCVLSLQCDHLAKKLGRATLSLVAWVCPRIVSLMAQSNLQRFQLHELQVLSRLSKSAYFH